MSRIEKLVKELPETIDCAVITSDINRRYFTGMKSSAGTLLVFKEKAYLIIDFRYFEKASKTVEDCEVILQNRLFEQIKELLLSNNAKTVAVESRTMTLSDLTTYKSKLEGYEFDTSDTLSNAIRKLRSVKSAEEIDKMVIAQRIAENAFTDVLNFIKEGRTEKEIALFLDNYMLRNGAEAVSFDIIALSGKNTSVPHGVPTDKAVVNGDFVLMDFGAVYQGYHSDMTRTVCVGKPTDKMAEVYNIVLNAQTAAKNKIKAGIKGSELDKIARDIIEEAGYGQCFGHSLGHSVGVEIHEYPNAAPSCNELLKNGNVITVEPGIYISDEFGVRIEDFGLVKKDGFLNFTNATNKLICL